jgi:hypothetical protein
MKYIIKIKDNKTNEIKDFYEHGMDTDNYYLDTGYSFDEIITFNYLEGNRSCDCNQYSMFYSDKETNFPCYDDEFKGNRFETISIIREDGKVIFRDSAPTLSRLFPESNVNV